jgi:CheY-like chemotaxis protein
MPKGKTKTVVLLADDHPQTVASCREAVEKAGYRVLVAGDLAEVERIITQSPPGFILLDAALPGGGVKQFLVRFRSSSTAPIMLLVPPRFDPALLSDLRPLADDALMKPFGVEAFDHRFGVLTAAKRPSAAYTQEGTDGRPLVRETPPEGFPREVGGCRLERILGRGTTATVYLGRHVLLNVPVAVKVLPLGGPGWLRADLERFLRGARAAARIQHPNVVPVIHAGNEETFCFLVQTYVEGASLRHRLDNEGAMPPEAVREIVTDVAAGLGAAHRLGIIHRDVKPGNIILTISGKAMLTDFGLARMRGDDDVSSGSGLVGTLYYMSPEQCEGKPLDARSDLYSLGATAYHALSGRPPFEGGAPLEVLRAHAGKRPAPLGELLPPQAKGLARIVMRLLEKKPEDRYGGAEELLADLGRL